MKSFIYKDMQLMKKFLVIIAIYQTILLFIGDIVGNHFIDAAHYRGTDSIIAGTVSRLSVCIGCALIYFLFNLDEKNKANIYLNSMPVKKISRVIARYIAIVIFSMIIFLNQALVTGIIHIMYKTEIDGGLFEYEFLCMIWGIAIMCLIAPFFFKFTANKAILIGLLTWSSIAILVVIIMIPNNVKLENIDTFNITPICAFILVISCAISFMFYKKREF